VRRIVPRWAAVAAFGLAGVLMVAGCVPSSWHIGSAMLYQHQTVVKTKPYRLSGFMQARISNTRLTAEVANLTAGYNKYKHKTQINYTAADIPREVLSWMLRFATENQLAAKLNFTVTSAEAQKALSAEKANVARAGDTLEEAAVLNGLPPDMLPQLGAWIQIQIELDKVLDNGKAPTTTTAQAALTAKTTHLLCLVAKSMHIKVNPQYGVYDYGQLSIVAAPPALSAPSPAPSATKIQSKPNC
jgi:hypothetical protein